MSAEIPTGEPDQYKTTLDPTQYIPTLDSLVVNPNQLIALVRSRENEAIRLSEVALLSGDTLTPQTAYEHLDEARTSALRQIVIPEAEAQLTKQAELTAHSLLEENSSVTIDKLREVTEGSDALKQARVLRELTDELPLVLRATSMLQDMLSDRRSISDPAMTGGRLRQIRDFVEKYRSAHITLIDAQDKKLLATTFAKSSQSGLIDKLDRLEGHYFMEKEAISESPAQALNDQTVDAITERGAQSVSEHQDSCSDEVKQSEKRQREVKDASKAIDDQVYRVMANLVRGQDGISSIVGPGKLEDAVNDLVKDIKSIQSNAEAHVRYAAISAEEVKRLLRDMKTKLDNVANVNKAADNFAQHAISQSRALTDSPK